MSDMLQEAKDAPEKVKQFLLKDQDRYRELGARLRKLNPSVVATVARGSSDHAAQYAAYLIPLCTGKVVASIPPSLVSILKAPLDLKNQFALAISQSGASPDIINTLERIKKSGALTAALVNQEESRLAQTAEVSLSQNAGVEKSITATKSVLCTMTAIAKLTAEWSEDQNLKNALENLIEPLKEAVRLGTTYSDQILKNVSHVYVLSRGLGLTSALETALKLKETCGIHAEAFSAAELRHGPREIVDKNYLVVALALPGSGHDDVFQAAKEMKAQGAKVLMISPDAGLFDYHFVLPDIEDFRLAPIVALQLLYPWLARSSKALGRDPDHPHTLHSKVIKTV